MAMKPSSLTSEQFIAWRLGMKMSQKAAANRLGISMSSIFVYETGRRKEGIVYIPLTVALAMSAIKANLNPYQGEADDHDHDK